MLQALVQTGASLVETRFSRRVAVLVNAGVIQRGRDGLARIRNVSAGGLCIQTSLVLEVGAPADIELQDGTVLHCTVRWAKNRQAGLCCDTDPGAALATKSADSDRPILPRFTRIQPVELIVNGKAHVCALDSISTCDFLATEGPLLVRGQLFSANVEGLGLLPAVVRISEDGELFARFATPIGFNALDAWLVR